jgi:serine/threonine-protein kinase
LSEGTFGKYEILEQIASGSSTELFKARRSGIGGFSRSLAIKRLMEHRNRDREYVDGFVAEARRAGLLSHANIVQILDLGQIDGAWFVSMEFVDGPDLAQVLARCRAKGITLPVPHSVFICIEVLKALEYAHSRQVMRGGRTNSLQAIHNNISPEKILLSAQGEVKLTDFANPATGGHSDYRAPEQVSGAPTEKSDLYSCGIILYEMLTGVHPSETGQKPPSHVNPDVPFSLDSVILAVLKEEQRFRFATATAMKRSLDDFFHDSGFIFSHSTLASFLKGLFPDPKQRRRQALGDQETLLLNRQPPPVPDGIAAPENPMEDMPTRINAPPVLPPAELRKRFPIGESISRLTLPILEEAGDDPTLIESNVDMWAEAKTVIKRDPSLTNNKSADDLEATRLTTAPPPPMLPPKSSNQIARRAPPPRSGTPSPETSEHSSPPAAGGMPANSQRFLILFTAISVVAMVGMLFLGFFVGRHATLVRPAQLTLDYPDSTQIMINGQPHDGSTVDLKAGRRHKITIRPQQASDSPAD